MDHERKEGGMLRARGRYAMMPIMESFAMR